MNLQNFLTFRLIIRMAEPCPSPNSDNISSSTSTLSADTITKADCTSPSPTETVCLENLCVDSNIPGPSHDKLVPLKHEIEISVLTDKDIPAEEKDLFFNKLGLDKVEDSLDLSNDDRYSNSHDEDNWEDCDDGIDVEGHQVLLQVAKDEV